MSGPAKATLAVMVAAAVAAAIVIGGHYGLVPGCDFGSGQYYYTDIPGWERIFGAPGARDTHSWSLYLGLFFGWGFLMYWLWKRIDR